MFDTAPLFLLRDCDGIYGAAFVDRADWNRAGRDRRAQPLPEAMVGGLHRRYQQAAA